uniref:DH domain-containing protein n=1 Tax=Bursaphelenchus xylophilus TaxID=6326 RepID=A0A1I7RYI1_BURXY
MLFFPQRKNKVIQNFFVWDADQLICTCIIEVIAGRTLIDTLTPFLTQNGVGPSHVDVFVENSSTPIPAISPAEYLVGQRLNIRPKQMHRSSIQGQFLAASNLTLTANVSLRSINNLASHSVDEADVRSLDEHDTAHLIPYHEKASSSRQHLNPMSFYEAQHHSTVPRRKGSLNVDSAREHSQEGRDVCRFPSQSSMSGSLNGTRRLRAPSSSRRMILFGKEKEKERFIAQLDAIYSAISEVPIPSYLDITEKFTDLVKPELITEYKVQKHQAAIWEIVTTEHSYIVTLKNICDLHTTLLEIQKENYLTDINSKDVFLNFSEIYQTTLNFWRQGILPMLQQSRTTGDLLDATCLQQAFADIRQWSRCYVDFQVEQNHSRNYITHKIKQDEQFADFVKWTESMPFFNRQKLLDVMAFPFQHLTRYSLLLQTLEKTALNEADLRCIQRMKAQTDEANHELNRSLNLNDLRAQFRYIMSLFESCDYMDFDEYEKATDTKQPMIDLLLPMPMIPHPMHRHLIRRGDLKFKESKSAPKIEVHVFLFTDMFLICKFGRRDKLRVVRPPIHITSMRYRVFMDSSNGFYLMSYDNFNVCINFLTFFTQTEEDAKKWIDFFDFAQGEFLKLKNAMVYAPYSHSMSVTSNTFPRNSDFSPESMALYHRKSHSMDSQALAQQQNGLRKESEIASAEQLDRRGFDQHPPIPHPKPQKILVDDDPGLQISPDSCASALVAVPPLMMNSTTSTGESSRCNTPVTPSGDSPTSGRNTGRRFEKRYHTVSGECDAAKSTAFNAGVIGQNIVKRFSWNVGSQRKISNKLNDTVNKTSLGNRRFSQSTTESSDSFGSSTSGISSSSSHDNHNIHHSNDELLNSNISRVRIDEMSELSHHHIHSRNSSTQSHNGTLRDENRTISLNVNEDIREEEQNISPNPSEKPPPLPHGPPPDTESSSSDGENVENKNVQRNGKKLQHQQQISQGEELEKFMHHDSQTDLFKLILSDDVDTSIV